jgi:thymidylate synthase
MKQYLEILEKILTTGTRKTDRTGVGTLSLFGEVMRFDLAEGFPALTTKRVYWKGVVAELLWFLSGSTNNNDLEAMGTNIWREWAKPDGDLGPIYGKQWMSWEQRPVFVTDGDIAPTDSYGYVGTDNGKWYWPEPINQIAELVERLKKDPFSRRHVVTAWNVADIPKMSLASCHFAFQMNVRPITPEQIELARLMDFSQQTPDKYLDCLVNIRSNDFFLGNPFNVASYALLTHILAAETGMAVGNLNVVMGDCHLYLNHISAAKIQLTRTPKLLPKLYFEPKMYNAYKVGDFSLKDYFPHPSIPAPIAV